MRWSTAALTFLAMPAEGTDSGRALSSFRRQRHMQATPNPTAGLPNLKKVTGLPGPDPILGECEADCDEDGDCQIGLRCFQRWGNEEVPGCVGTGFKKEDFCYNQTAYPNYLLTSKGKDIKDKLGVCEGPCKRKGDDNNCESGLECFIRKIGVGHDGFAPVPGCLGVGKEGNDYCIGKSLSLTGSYSGYDTEDSSTQFLQVQCNESHCDIILADPRFTTCEQAFDGDSFFTGVAIASSIPINSLDDFRLDLYCLQPGEQEIDFEDEPTTTLTGNILQLPDGGIRRTGPGFTYSKISLPQIKDDGGTLDIHDKSVNLNGRYIGTDMRDGSLQGFEIICTKKTCDIILLDASFGACKDENSEVVYFGIGYVNNVPRDSLDDFEIEVYCVPEGELIVDPSKEPDDTIPTNLELLQNGIIRRTDLKATYFKISPDETAGGFSIYEDFTAKYDGTDTEDGSFQTLEVNCQEGLCDFALQDTSFSTCIEATGAEYLGGLATAKDVPQDSLFDFKLNLYCASDIFQGIDYSEPAASLTGNMAFLQDGIVRRTGPGFNYGNFLKKRKALNGLYRGGILPSLGSQQILKILCGTDTCEVILSTYTWLECAVLGGRLFDNGIAVNPAVPKKMLGDFDINLYCVPPGVGEIIDYENQTPLTTIKAKIVVDDTNPGIAFLTMDYPYPLEYKLFKWSDE